MTLTGIKRIKEQGAGRCFKSQYWTSPGICARADGWLMMKTESDLLDRDPRKEAERQKEQQKKKERLEKKKASYIVEPGLEPVSLRKPGFKFNKKEVRHRVLAVFNYMREAPQIYQKGVTPCMYFFTVSFKAGTRDKQCYELLNIWLTSLRQQGKLKSYLWVAERQKNGTIHFHVLIPHRLRVQIANTIMRQSILGYIKKGKITHWPESEARRYNGVDIAKNRKTKRVTNFALKKSEKALQQYITKYVSKNNDVHQMQPWRCSRDWSALVKGVNVTRDFAAGVLGNSGRLLDQKNNFENEYIQFWRWLSDPPIDLRRHLAQINYEMLRVHFGCGEEYFFNLN